MLQRKKKRKFISMKLLIHEQTTEEIFNKANQDYFIKTENVFLKYVQSYSTLIYLQELSWSII